MKLQARLVVAVLTQIMQLVLYCIPADYITHAAMEVSDAIYDSGWNLQYSSSLKSIITLAVQQSQQEIPIRAGGFIDLNSRAVISVLKASWSICTVMKRMKGVQN